MSKMRLSFSKLSFSLIMALLLVGMLGTAAFAKDPYAFKPYQGPSNSLIVPFTGNSSDPDDVQGTRFTVTLKDPDGKVVKTYQTQLGSDNKASVTIPAADITPSVVYTVELTHTGNAKVLSTSTALVTENHNTFSGPALDTHGTGLYNANQTGYNNTRKQRSGQKVHGFYENNTNSCASCHQTHTAADNNLLMKDGAYSTCASCHDGTMGAKNVWSPITEDTVKGIAGTFNYTLNHNSSIHEADGSLQVTAAPGAGKNSTTLNQTFDCASCHAPHGNGTGSSENNLNFDPMGWGGVEYKANGTDDQQNGKLFKDTTVQTSVPKDFVTPYILVKKTVTAADVDGNFFYKRANVPANSNLIQTYRWDGSKGYVADYSLWLQGGGYGSTANTALMDASGKDITSQVSVIWRDGFAFGAKVADITKATFSIGIDVETTTNIRSLFDSSYSGYIPDSGVQMSKYCSACHTDYLSATRKDSTGVYSVAHRHQTSQDRLTCVRCHYGHGTDAQIMKDANDKSFYDLKAAGMSSEAALDYLKDPNPSSALKRYTGMSVCYGCHGTGSAFKNNPNNHPNKAGVPDGNVLLPGQPGTR